MWGECQPTVLKAVRSFEEGRAALTSHVYDRVWKFLYARVRSRRWRRKVSKSELPPAGREPAAPESAATFDLAKFLGGLSLAAQAAVRLVLLRGFDRRRLVKTLSGFGWEAAEVARVFEEIREAL